MFSADLPPQSPQHIPIAPCIERKYERKKVARSSSWIPPEVAQTDFGRNIDARMAGQADMTSSSPSCSSSHVLRTKSAEELEYYKITAGILGEPYRDVNLFYESEKKTLGEGSSGIIKRCFHRETGQVYALKTIPKSKLTCPEAVEDVQNEVKVMRAMGRHPCILELKETFEDHNNVHLILEICEGGDLYDRIQKLKRFSEMEAARICRRLLSAVHHFHSHGFIHRDIKPENILLHSRDSNVDIRLADFGQAVPVRPGKMLTQTVGSVFYVAPEVLNRSYSTPADMWSVGVILYILLSGKPPFSGPNRRSTFELIKHAPVDFEREAWRSVSEEAKDLILRLLDRNPETRMTSQEAKLHPWMMKYCPTIQSQPPARKLPYGDSAPTPVSTLSGAFSDLTVSAASSCTSSPKHVKMSPSRDLSRGSSGDHRPMIPAFARLGHGLPHATSPPSPYSDPQEIPQYLPSSLRSYSSLPSPKDSNGSPVSLAQIVPDGTCLGRKFSLDSGVPSGPPKSRRSSLKP